MTGDEKLTGRLLGREFAITRRFFSISVPGGDQVLAVPEDLDRQTQVRIVQFSSALSRWDSVVTTPHGSRAWGFWIDTRVSSHTNRSVHAHQRALLEATDVSHGTTLEHGRIFTSGPLPENPPKRDLVANVQ
jgi:hypothetical protein